MDPLNRIETKLDKILETQIEHSILLSRHTTLHEKNTADLEYHIARTNELQNKVERHEVKVDIQMEEALLPIKSIKWLGKVLAGCLVVASLIIAILKIKGQ